MTKLAFKQLSNETRILMTGYDKMYFLLMIFRCRSYRQDISIGLQQSANL